LAGGTNWVRRALGGAVVVAIVVGLGHALGA
jgi:hypothetical protein